jgi:hypothetical protein
VLEVPASCLLHLTSCAISYDITVGSVLALNCILSLCDITMSGSNAIAIPKRKGKQPVRHSVDSSMASTPTSSSARSGGFATPNSNQNRFGSFSTPANRFSYGSYESTPSGSPSNEISSSAKRRESLMSATFSKQEHTVINVGEEESPRLITCVKASQGFDWNQGTLLVYSFFTRGRDC